MPTRSLEVQSTSVRHLFLITVLLFTTSTLESVPPSTPPFAPPLPYPNVACWPLLAESAFCWPFVLVARWQLAVVSWTHVDPTYRIQRCRLTHVSVIGINIFVSRHLSVCFVDGGGKGKSPSTNSVPTIVDISSMGWAVCLYWHSQWAYHVVISCTKKQGQRFYRSYFLDLTMLGTKLST